MKMKRADEQEQGQHQDEIVIGSGKPRFFTGVWFSWNFESVSRHGISLTKPDVCRVATFNRVARANIHVQDLA